MAVVTEQRTLEEMLYMKLHESFQLTSETRVTKVPNGWIYQTYKTAVFVPEEELIKKLQSNINLPIKPPPKRKA